MQSQQEYEKEVKEEVLESRNTEVREGEALPVRRNKRSARCYFMTMAAVYLVLLIMAVVALANFGIREAEINRLKSQNKLAVHHPEQTCILFAKHIDDPDDQYSNKIITELHSSALCGYVLWGLISITIVAFVWLIYNVVLAAIGPKM